MNRSLIKSALTISLGTSTTDRADRVAEFIEPILNAGTNKLMLHQMKKDLKNQPKHFRSKAEEARFFKKLKLNRKEIKDIVISDDSNSFTGVFHPGDLSIHKFMEEHKGRKSRDTLLGTFPRTPQLTRIWPWPNIDRPPNPKESKKIQKAIKSINKLKKTLKPNEFSRVIASGIKSRAVYAHEAGHQASTQEYLKSRGYGKSKGREQQEGYKLARGKTIRERILYPFLGEVGGIYIRNKTGQKLLGDVIQSAGNIPILIEEHKATGYVKKHLKDLTPKERRALNMAYGTYVKGAARPITRRAIAAGLRAAGV
jgi:hypothetical protein